MCHDTCVSHLYTHTHTNTATINKTKKKLKPLAGRGKSDMNSSSKGMEAGDSQVQGHP